MDIGANTGKWSLKCMEYDKEVELGLVDLGVQLNVAKQNIEEANFGDRATYHEMDIRDPKNTLPKGYDIIWMSQFLDCFSDEQIVDILKKCHAAAGRTPWFLSMKHFGIYKISKFQHLRFK